MIFEKIEQEVEQVMDEQDLLIVETFDIKGNFGGMDNERKIRLSSLNCRQIHHS